MAVFVFFLLFLGEGWSLDHVLKFHFDFTVVFLSIPRYTFFIVCSIYLITNISFFHID